MVLGHPALEFFLAINFQNFAYEEGCELLCYKVKHFFLKAFKDKVKALLTHLETKHEEHPCIVLFDETQLVLGDLTLGKSNWTDLCFGSNNCHVIFCFSPLQKYCGD